MRGLKSQSIFDRWFPPMICFNALLLFGPPLTHGEHRVACWKHRSNISAGWIKSAKNACAIWL